jgi:SAM-dependent methyltransferase
MTMIEVAKRREQENKPFANLEYLHLATEDLARLFDCGPFDGAFSNFSGLNCLADLKPVARNLAGAVKPGGRVLLCLWSRVGLVSLSWPTEESCSKIVETGHGQTRGYDDFRFLSLSSLSTPFFFSLVRTEGTLRGWSLCASLLR